MCGIAGFWSPGGLAPDADATLRRMTDAIRYRGPDDAGAWLDPDAGIALGHRRLSILDLSPEGHQPMRSRDGRWVMTFNGEIYNFAELRAELEAAGETFRGHSDTEVMLAAFSRWGLRPAVERMAGMFAFAVWDRERRALSLVRDRFGEKPLYYGWCGRTLLFGSELKALRAHPEFRGDVDRAALTLYLRHNYVPAPHSIYQGISKLRPGHIATTSSVGAMSIEPYWSLFDAVEQGRSNPVDGSDDDLVTLFAQRLGDTVREEMVSDVPLGALLSGGIDSTTIAALMQRAGTRRVRTFSVGFHEKAFDEAGHARAVAAHLGTEHTEMYVSPDDALAVIPHLPFMYDEPFADVSQIPTHLVSRLARQHVTVALSGDGGDELLGGYARYGQAIDMWARLRGVPLPLRQLAGAALGPIAGLTGRGRITARTLGQPSLVTAYEQLVSHRDDPAGAVRRGEEPASSRLPAIRVPEGLPEVERLMFLDALTYLPDDIMVKVDRASMAVSLETRAPLLDHRVAELAWRLPLRMKVRNGETKWVLRQVAYRHVPRKLLDRPKQGFAVPIGAWTAGPLRAWARALTAPDRIGREGFFDPAQVQRLHDEVERGRPGATALWTILMFQAWLEQNEMAVA